MKFLTATALLLAFAGVARSSDAPKMYGMATDGSDRIISVGERSTILARTEGSDELKTILVGGLPSPRLLFMCGFLDPKGTALVVTHDGKGAKIDLTGAKSSSFAIPAPTKSEYTSLAVDRLPNVVSDRIALGTGNGRVVLLSKVRGSKPVPQWLASKGIVLALGFSPCGHRLAAGGTAGKLTVWQVGDSGASEPATIEIGDKVTRIAWVSNTQLIAACENGNVYSVNDPYGKAEVARVDGRLSVATSLAVSKGKFAVGFQDGTVSVYDAKTFAIENTLATGDSPVCGLCFNREMTGLVTLNMSGKMVENLLANHENELCGH